MKLLELFCGTKSISKEFEKLGFECTTLDFDPQFNPDICTDILTFDYRSLPRYDVIWASPPCTAFSVAQIGKNWYHDDTPKTDKARLGLEILEKTIEVIRYLGPRVFFIENPRGKMRKMSVLECLNRQTVTYCQYGDFRMKPTDIWSNSMWEGKMCKNGDTCHTPAPRGSTTGTQGMGSAVDKGVIPPLLCREIAAHCYGILRAEQYRKENDA